MRVTAHLEGSCAGIVGQPFMLDGPLAWAEAVTGNYSPITKGHAPEIPVPLETWEKNGLWGHKTSRAHYDVTAYGSLEIRRKPSDREYSRYTKDRKNHHALGPYKARDLVIETAIIPEIWWDIEPTDAEKLETLLQLITHLGSHRAIGLGKVTHWELADGPENGWEDRPFTLPTRPPYWHQERRTC